MPETSIKGNFNGGELAPDLWGHVDLAKYATSVATARNVFVNYRGGLNSRAGTALVGRCKQQPPAAPPRDINFDFSLTQGYALEFGDNYMRIKSNGAYVTEPPIAMTAITQANPAQISANHNFADGDWVFIEDPVSGMIELNAKTYIVQNSIPTVSFTITDLDGVPVNSTGFPPYTGGGTVARLYTLVTPYAAVDLPYLKFAQSADVVSLTCVNLTTGTEYPPQELSRFGLTNWTIAPLNLASQIAAPTALTAVASNNPNPGLSPPTQPCAYAYVVTAVNLNTGEESNASIRADVTNTVDMSVTAGSITLTWNPVTSAAPIEYNIYRTAPAYNTDPSSTANALPVPAGALFFYAGSAYGTQFIDSNVTTDSSKTPPIHRDPFAVGQVPSVQVTSSSADWTTASVSISSATGSGWEGEVVIVAMTIVAVIVDNSGENYTSADTLVFSGTGTSAAGTLNIGPQSGTDPAVVAYFQQRRFYLQTLNEPDTYWGSQEGLFTNFDSGNPPVASDAVTGTPFSQTVDGIQWALNMPGGFVMLTGIGAWQVTGTSGSALNPEPITPSSQQATSQAFYGADAVCPPVRINYDILFLSATGQFFYDLNYNLYFNIYYAADISWPSAHLFVGHGFPQNAWCPQPFKVLWVLRDDGILLALTYIKEQEVMGWARADTQGIFKGLCSVAEVSKSPVITPNVNALYLIVQRYVQGRWLYFSERMDDRYWPTTEDAWCVDCGLTTLGPTNFPAASLTASAATGAGVTFTASSAVFNGANVGAVLRMGGGIATLTAAGAAGGTQATGTWTRPLTATMPGDPGNMPLPAPGGTWSLVGQTGLVTLPHLAGKQVVGLADGIPIGIDPALRPQFPWLPAVSFGLLVADPSGNVMLPFTASLVTVGLSFATQVQSLYLDADQPTQQGRRKSINAVTARVANSGWPCAAANEADGSAQDPPQVAPAWTGLKPLQPAPPGTAPPGYTTAVGQSVTPLYTGDLRVNIPSTWRKPGQVAIQQSLPMPLNLTAIIPEYLDGDMPEQAIAARTAGGSAGRSARPPQPEGQPPPWGAV